MSTRSKLPSRQKLFVEKYIANGMNGSRAAVEAGYSPKTARVTASQLLTKPNIKSEVSRRIREVLTDTEVMTLQWLKQVKSIAEYDMRKAAEWDENTLTLKPSSQLDDSTAMAIQEVQYNSTESGTTMKIKAYDKVRALEQLAKFLGVIGDGFTVEERSEEHIPNVDSMSPAQRRERIAELYRKLNGKVD